MLDYQLNNIAAAMLVYGYKISYPDTVYQGLFEHKEWLTIFTESKWLYIGHINLDNINYNLYLSKDHKTAWFVKV